MPSARLEGSCWSAGMTHRTLWKLSHSQLQFTARKEHRLTSAREEMHKVKSGGSIPLPPVESGQCASPRIDVWQHSWRMYHPPGKLTPASVFRVFTGSSVTTEYAAGAPLSKSVSTYRAASPTLNHTARFCRQRHSYQAQHFKGLNITWSKVILPRSQGQGPDLFLVGEAHTNHRKRNTKAPRGLTSQGSL